MSDTISQLQKYAYLVPEKYKVYVTAERIGFSIEGLKILRDHPLVEHELKDDLTDFIYSLEYSD